MLPVYQDSTFLGHIDKAVEIERWGSNVVLLPVMSDSFDATRVHPVSFDLERRCAEFTSWQYENICASSDAKEELWFLSRVPPTAKCDHNAVSDTYRFSWQIVKIRNAAEHKLIFMMPDFVPAAIGEPVLDEEETISVSMTHGIATMRPFSEKLTDYLRGDELRRTFVSAPREHGKTSVPTIAGMKADFVVMDELASIKRTKAEPPEDKLKSLLNDHFSAVERRMAVDLVNTFKHGTAATVTSNVAEGGLESLKPVSGDDLKRKIAEQIRELTGWKI